MIVHTKWAKENVLPVVQMLSTAFADDNVTIPVLFEHFPTAGETFLSAHSTLRDENLENDLKNEGKEGKVEGAAFLPGMSSTLRESKPPPNKKDHLRQQRLTAIYEDENLNPEQKYFMMEYIRQAGDDIDTETLAHPGETGEEDPLVKRFNLKNDETDQEIYAAPQPHSNQYHSLPDVKLPKFHGNPLEFH